MKKLSISISVFLIFIELCFCQVNNLQLPTSINSDGADPDSSAILDIQSNTQGVLIPRMTRLQRLLIDNPAKSLLVYDIDSGSEGFWFYNGSQWVNLADEFINVDDADADPTNEIELPIGGQEGQVLGIVHGLPKWIYPPMPVDSGDEYGGGIVFHIFEPGELGYVPGEQHGLIGAMATLDSAEWGCMGTATNANFEGLGRGELNTTLIQANCGQPASAADLCSSLTLNGFTDWFLPSEDEFLLMRSVFFYTPYKIIQDCWTSTEYKWIKETQAVWVVGSTGFVFTHDKDEVKAVRPVRAF